MFFQYFLKKVARQQIIKRIFLKKEAENAPFQERQKIPHLKKIKCGQTKCLVGLGSARKTDVVSVIHSLERDFRQCAVSPCARVVERV